jgi:16S rRNA (cytosine1402-N4)-methyltransferase
MEHIPVLLSESLKGLSLSKGATFIDATLGLGGHSLAICKELAGKVAIYGFDEDRDALMHAEGVLRKAGCETKTFNKNFRTIKETLGESKVADVDGVLFDLGVSSYQIDESGRGFTFKKDEPLKMTLGKNKKNYVFNALDVVNEWEEESIANVIFAYGEEKYSRRIARAIVEKRLEKPIKTTGELAEVIKNAVPASYRHGRIHPATRTFQAFRIVVNDELGALREGLQGAWQVLRPGGRLAVISFHSLEDREVKQFMKLKGSLKEGLLINKKPIEASDEELKNNKRARSAKLRIIEKIR